MIQQSPKKNNGLYVLEYKIIYWFNILDFLFNTVNWFYFIGIILVLDKIILI